jgi:hypothetical protein
LISLFFIYCVSSKTPLKNLFFFSEFDGIATPEFRIISFHFVPQRKSGQLVTLLRRVNRKSLEKLVPRFPESGPVLNGQRPIQTIGPVPCGCGQSLRRDRPDSGSGWNFRFRSAAGRVAAETTGRFRFQSSRPDIDNILKNIMETKTKIISAKLDSNIFSTKKVIYNLKEMSYKIIKSMLQNKFIRSLAKISYNENNSVYVFYYGKPQNANLKLITNSVEICRLVKFNPPESDIFCLEHITIYKNLSSVLIYKLSFFSLNWAHVYFYRFSLLQKVPFLHTN